MPEPKMKPPTDAAGCFAHMADLYTQVAADRALQKTLARVANLCVKALKKGGRVLICGNGGSASQATHFAGELVGPFYDRKRPGYAGIPLGFDVGSLTAVANDFGFETAYARQIEALGQKSDVLWALTTSGNSANVLAAMKQARKQKLTTVLFTNHDGGTCRRWADHLLYTPPAPTPRVQELHLGYGHWLCQDIEAQLAAKGRKKTARRA